MSREPALLTRSLLAAHRPGVAVAVAEGMALGIPTKRPTGHLLHSRPRAEIGAGVVGGRPVAPQGPGVAVIQIRGVITQHEEWSACGEAANFDEITARVCDAHGDPGVGALLIDCETIGGDVAGGEEAIETMTAAAQASGKPVFGYVGARCFSMGVWLLSGICNAGIVVHRSARMGSIGVVCEHESDARKLTAAGIDRTIFRYPPGKAVPGPEELDALGTQRMQALVDEPGQRFVAHVAATRGIDPAVILAWNGGTFTGPEIVAAKLADSLGSLDSTIALAGTLAGFQEAA